MLIQVLYNNNKGVHAKTEQFIVLRYIGGPCVCNPPAGATGMAALCVGDPDYEACKLIVRQDLITATCAIACLASALMGTFANLPMGMAPG